MLILTLNEAINIQRCMESLSWSDDIVVLDSLSSDDTVKLAETSGASVYQRAFDNFASQRNYALDEIKFKHEWILHLDADEVVTPELRDEIAQAVANPDFSAWRIASKLMFMGKWLRYSGMYPTYQVRLGQRDQLRFIQEGHGQREALASNDLGTLQNPYIHYGFSKGMADWIEKHNRYSTDEALKGLEVQRKSGAPLKNLFATDRTQRRRALKQLAVRLPFRPMLRFLYMYVLKLGFLDGRAGFYYCRLMANYEYWIVLKMRELRKI